MVEKDLLTIRIFRALRGARFCPLCYLYEEEERRTLDNVMSNEVVMDPTFRKKVISSFGFCSEHTYLLLRRSRDPKFADGMGLALYLQSVVEEILKRPRSKGLERRRGLRWLPGAVRSPMTRGSLPLRDFDSGEGRNGKASCPICESMESMDKIDVSTLVGMLGEDEFRSEFLSSYRLCIPHFVSVLRSLLTSDQGAEGVVEGLIEAEERLLVRIHRMLSEFLRKQSWEARGEQWGEEREANLIAVRALLGAKRLRVYRCHLSSRGG